MLHTFKCAQIDVLAFICWSEK